MRRSYNSKLSNCSHENRSISPNALTVQRSPSCRVLESSNSSAFLKVGIYAINSEKKYSLLSVPKTPVKFLNICNENRTPSSIDKVQQSIKSFRSMNLINRPQLSKLSSISKSDKEANKPVNSRNNAVHSYRFRQNPNHENLKKALEDLEKSVPKILNQSNIVNTVSENPKSDIELILESQCGNNIRCSKSPSQAVRLDLDKICSNCVHKHEISQRSDPSPVHKDKSQVRRLESSKSSNNRVKRLLKIKKEPLNLHNQHTKDYYSRNSIKPLDSSASDASSSDLDILHRPDSQPDTMRILKNTKSFAQKIMKVIRGSVNRKFY